MTAVVTGVMVTRRRKSLTLQVRMIQILIFCFRAIYGWEEAPSPTPSPTLVYLRSQACLSISLPKLRSDMACTDVKLSHGLPRH